jgi:hypothetical protein
VYERYTVVFDGTVVGVENMDREEAVSRGLDPIPHRVATFEVHRARKGVSGDRVQLLIPGGWSRKERIVVDVSEQLRLTRGDRYVIFGGVDPAGYVRASACSPSTPYRAAVTVLEFLHSLDRPPTGGVITGIVRTYWDPLEPGAEEPKPGVTRVMLSGVGVHRSAAVRDEPFEFGGLQPGTYSVSVTRPPGMKESGPGTVTLAAPRSCEQLFISNIFDTRVRGVVKATNGQPLEGVRIGVADGSLSTYTDAAGFFEFQGIPPGRYRVFRTLRIEPEYTERRSAYEVGDKPMEVTVALRKPVDLGTLYFGPLFGVILELELKRVADKPLRRH